MLRGITVQTFAEELVRLVAEDRLEFPDQYARARSWSDLHDVCDANEYLIAADKKFGWEQDLNDEYIGFCNEAIEIAEATLFPVKYPEHEKLQAVKEQSQAIGAFLDFTGYQLCEVRTLVDEWGHGRWFPVHKSINEILADYFEIDLDRIEQEKRAMLEECRAK